MIISFLGDTHNKLTDQNRLINNLFKYKDYDLWLEFLYPEDIINIKLKKYDLVLKNLMNNNWSLEYNKNIIRIIKHAVKLKINIYPLENHKFSLKSFLEKYGIIGLLIYLQDRISDKPGGCNDRWVKMIKQHQLSNKKNQIIFSGKLHQDAILKFLN